jgi:indolepyruvate ferredoxin oxidoreductase
MGYAVELASLPEQMRGYGHVQAAAVAKARAREAELLNLFHNPPKVAVA